MSVMLCTGAIFVKKNSCLVDRIISLDAVGISTYFPNFRAFKFYSNQYV